MKKMTRKRIIEMSKAAASRNFRNVDWAQGTIELSKKIAAGDHELAGRVAKLTNRLIGWAYEGMEKKKSCRKKEVRK